MTRHDIARHDIECTDDTLIVRLRDRLTHRADNHFHDVLALLEGSELKRCDMDLEELDFIDSRGLSLLLTAGQIAESRAMTLRFVRPRAEVKERLDFVGMGNRIEIAY